MLTLAAAHVTLTVAHVTVIILHGRVCVGRPTQSAVRGLGGGGEGERILGRRLTHEAYENIE